MLRCSRGGGRDGDAKTRDRDHCSKVSSHRHPALRPNRPRSSTRLQRAPPDSPREYQCLAAKFHIDEFCRPWRATAGGVLGWNARRARRILYTDRKRGALTQMKTGIRKAAAVLLV